MLYSDIEETAPRVLAFSGSTAEEAKQGFASI